MGSSRGWVGGVWRRGDILRSPSGRSRNAWRGMTPVQGRRLPLRSAIPLPRGGDPTHHRTTKGHVARGVEMWGGPDRKWRLVSPSFCSHSRATHTVAEGMGPSAPPHIDLRKSLGYKAAGRLVRWQMWSGPWGGERAGHEMVGE